MSAKGTPNFAGVIIARKGSGITKSADLKGKKVISYQFGVSAGAWVFQTYHVMQQGVNPSDFASFTESKKQDDIPLAVKSGIVDVGFVRTGLLESMQKEGKLSVDDFIIVEERKDDLPFLHSTALYPEWFMVAGKKLPDDIAAKVGSAIMSLKPSDAAAKNAGIDGFVAPVSLSELETALKALKVAPFAN
jgi:ABC-type phosphate/phosphonate transport system substrate-binding protein